MAMAVQWSSLPGDILNALSKILNTDTDLLRFRSVCSHWRSSLPPPRKLFSFPLKVPSLLPLADWFSGNADNCHFVLNQSTVYRLSPPESGPCAGDSSDGWLFKVSETSANTFSLQVPLAADKIKCDPGMVPNHLNLLDYRISEVRKSYSIELVDRDNSSEKSPIFIIKKVIVLWNYVANCVLAVLVLRYGGRMVYWKFGDDEWTAIDTRRYEFQDLIFFDEKCYAISSKGVLVSFDSQLNLTEVGSLSPTMGCQRNQQNYLVECKSELYVVAKISDPDPEFYFDYTEDWPVCDLSSINIPLKIKIFKKFDDWHGVHHLGYMVLFLGDDVSFGVSAEDFGGFKGNCIFLTDECFYDEGVGSVYGDDAGVYDLDLRTVKSLVEAQDHAKLFWPPPTWLMPYATSSGF